MFITSFTFQYAGMSDIGLVRSHNEDAWAAIEDKAVFLIADGMGGHKAGEVAAHEAIYHFSMLVDQLPENEFTSKDDIVDFFRAAFDSVNQAVFEKGQNPEYSGMGTTLCAVYLIRDQALIMHVGDSRVYRYSNGKLDLLTMDHTLVSELTELGVIDEKESENFPYKHILTRAIGTNPSVETSFKFSPLQSEDILILCTDGLSNYVSAAEIKKIVSEKNELTKQCQMLINAAKQHGGGDNITVVIVQVH